MDAPNTLNKMSKYNNTIKAAFLLHFFRGQIISMPYLKIFHRYSYLVTTSVSSTLENLQIYQKIRNSLVEFSYTFNQFFPRYCGYPFHHYRKQTHNLQSDSSKYLLRYIAQCPVSYCLALLADGTYLFKNGPIVNSTKEFGTAREVLMKM